MMAEGPAVVSIQPHTNTFSHLNHEGCEPLGSQTDIDRRTPLADSGYVSQGSLPGLHDREAANSSRAPLPLGVPVILGGRDFRRYKKPPHEPCRAAAVRFGEIIDHIQPLLLERIKKQSARVGLVSFRQMFLGSNDETPCDYLVVLCPSNISSLVRDFFTKESAIRELCDPCDPYIPSFKVVVEGRPPRLVARVSGLPVFDDEQGRAASPLQHGVNLLGQPVKIMSPNGPKVAVCGGAIKLVRSDGSAQLYGMLAGHSVFDVDSLDSSDDLVANSREENLAPRTKEVNEDKRPAGQSDHGRQLGQVTVKGYGGIRNSTPDYDWALFEFSSGLMVLPSMYLGGTPVDVSYVGTNVGRFSRYISDQEVEIVGGNGLSRPGSLSNVPTRILLGLAEIATPVFTLTLREGEVSEGESGHWVVGSSTHEVFGHVVAVDMFGDAYVVPLDDTFEDIRQETQATSVQLPHENDFMSVFFDHNRNNAGDVPVLRVPQAVPDQLPQIRQPKLFDDGDSDIRGSDPPSIFSYTPSISTSAPSSIFSYESSIAGSLDQRQYRFKKVAGSRWSRRPKSPGTAREVIEE